MSIVQQSVPGWLSRNSLKTAKTDRNSLSLMTETYSQRDFHRPALGIQQPWCDLILQGKKRLEVRSQPTQIRGRIYLYASKKDSRLPEAIPHLQASAHELPRGVIVGSVELINCRRAAPDDASAACVDQNRLTDQYVWELAHPHRFPDPWPVTFLPFGVWFYPWRRKK